MNNGKRCGRPIYPSPAYDPTLVCLMHSRDPQKSDAAFQEEFEAILKAGDEVADFTKFVFPRANYVQRKFAEVCVFHAATFTEDVSFYDSEFTQDADFRGATFMQGASFWNAKFRQDANFGGATFKDVSFYDATFTREVSFYDAKFTQDSEFTNATFTQGAEFTKATFTRDALFGNAKFTQFVRFYRSTFEQSASFQGTKFMQTADFIGVTFAQNANFNAATFTQKVSFARAQFLGPAEFRETHFRRDEEPLPGPIFSLAGFFQPEAVIFYKTYLGRALFYNCDVSRVNFSSVEWRRRKGSRKWMVFEEEVHLEAAPDLKPTESSADERHYWLIVELYQQLKKNYDGRQDYGTGGDFHYGELEMKRLATRRKNNAVRWLVQHSRLVALYKFASQYGESYVRPGVLFVAALLLFALLYPVAGLRYEPKNDLGGNVSSIEPVILSYSNPDQQGVGPIQARVKLFGSSCLTALEIAAFQKEPAYKPVRTWGRALTLIEMLLTSTLAGLFFLAVRRQFRR
jgi:uncharacterized protein YjbI with pentapeptide repeats